MKRKFKVFLSSTFEDFKDARRALIMQTLRQGHIPAGMELFQAGDARNIDVIEDEIASSDIFVVLAGLRLGSLVSSGEHITFVMKEYDLAVKHKLPVIPFLLEPSEGKREAQLEQFYETIQQRPDGGRRIAAFFSHGHVDDLCVKYGEALRAEAEHLDTGSRGGGWVPGKLFDQLRALVMLGDSASTNPFFQRFAVRLGTFDKLSKRTAVEARAKAAIAGYFWEQYAGLIAERGITHIYFESGSSIAYVSRSFIEYVKEEDWFYAADLNSKLHLRTNNILTYLDFLLVEPPWRPMDIQLLPYGPFSQDYGATYGRLKLTTKINSPRSATERRRLSPETEREVSALRATMLEQFADAGLVLMATSGVDTDPASRFPGPHVGSPYNMLLKRTLISLPCPKVMFVDNNKWGYPFRLNACHSVCDDQLSWDFVKANTPLAIALAVQDRRRLDQIMSSLRENGFEHQEVGEGTVGDESAWPIIASNAPFASFFR